MSFNPSLFAQCSSFLATQQPQVVPEIKREDTYRLSFDGVNINFQWYFSRSGREEFRTEASFPPTAVESIEYRRVVAVHYVYIYLQGEVYTTVNRSKSERLYEIQIGFQNEEAAKRFASLCSAAF